MIQWPNMAAVGSADSIVDQYRSGYEGVKLHQDINTDVASEVFLKVWCSLPIEMTHVNIVISLGLRCMTI